MKNITSKLTIVLTALLSFAVANAVNYRVDKMDKLPATKGQNNIEVIELSPNMSRTGKTFWFRGNFDSHGLSKADTLRWTEWIGSQRVDYVALVPHS